MHYFENIFRSSFQKKKKSLYTHEKVKALRHKGDKLGLQIER